MNWLYLIGGIFFAGCVIGFAVCVFDAEVLNISKGAGCNLLKWCGILLAVDIVIVLIASLFKKK